MATQVFGTFIPKGSSTNKPPALDEKDYYYWKDKMRLFLESQDIDLWEIVEESPCSPTITNAKGASVSKPEEIGTVDEKTRVLLNSKGKFYLSCALTIEEYDKIAGCTIVKETWDTLKIAHEGTDRVKAELTLATSSFMLHDTWHH